MQKYAIKWVPIDTEDIKEEEEIVHKEVSSVYSLDWSLMNPWSSQHYQNPRFIYWETESLHRYGLCGRR